MSEEEKIEVTAEKAAKQKSLEMLFDYTKMHIGLYLTLTAAYVAVATAKVNGKPILAVVPEAVWLAIIAFMHCWAGGRGYREQHYADYCAE
jgi:hypothetical protein